MKNKTNGYVIGIIIIIAMFMAYSGNYMSMLRRVNYLGNIEETAFFYSLIDTIINVICVFAVPLIMKLIDGEFYKKNSKKICIINGIVWLFVSIPLYSTIVGREAPGIGILGALIYSIAVYNILRGNEKKNFTSQTNMLTAKQENLFTCSECGGLCNENDKYCKKCYAVFEEDTVEIEKHLNQNFFECDNCGAKVLESAKECPNCGELFEECAENNKDVTVDEIFKDAIISKSLSNNVEAKIAFKKYIAETEKVMKNISANSYTFANCVELAIASENGLLEENAISFNYKTSDAYMYLGFISFDEANYEECIKYQNKALKCNPCNITAMFEKAECYKAKGNIKKYQEETENTYNYIYNIFDLAHYYRNLGYYYIEKKDYDLSKALYLYSMKYDDNETAHSEIMYIAQKTNDTSLIEIEKLTGILRKNDIPTFISKRNLEVIKKLNKEIDESGNENSDNGKFLKDLIKKNANM